MDFIGSTIKITTAKATGTAQLLLILNQQQRLESTTTA